MSRWQRESLVLHLDAHVLRREGAAEAAVSAPWTAAALGAAVDALTPSGTRPGRLAVALGPSVCRHVVQQPVEGLRGLAELQGLSAARAARLLGGQPGDWVITADWSLSQPFVCAVMPRTLLDALAQLARERGATLSVTSSVLDALGRAAATLDGGFVAWTVPGGAVLAYLAREGPVSLRWLRCDDGLPAAELQALLQAEAAQESLRAGLRPTDIKLLEGAAA